MSIFYYDATLSAYESHFLWEQALGYLEKRYAERKENKILNTLVGFSWLYFIEGPIISKKFENDQNGSTLNTWRKYIDLGAAESPEDPFFCFIAGYTLSLHGFHISESYEKKGHSLMEACLRFTNDPWLQQLAENILLNEHAKQYHPLQNGQQICGQFFDGRSLLDRYFNEVFLGSS